MPSVETETVEQERTRYRRAYEGLRKAIETEIQQSRSVGENWRTHDLISNERNRIVMRLTEMLEAFDA